MFCPNCETNNQETSKFCSSCGTSLQLTAPATGEKQPFSEAFAAKAPWYYQSWFIALLLFTITPAGIVLMWLQKPRGKFFGKNFSRVIITIVFGFFWLSVISETSDESKQEKTDLKRETSKAAQKRAGPLLPSREKAFINAVSPFINKYHSAQNELKKSALRRKRANAINFVLNEKLVIRNWIGTLRTMQTNSQGKGIISVQLEGTKIRVETWNNAISDLTYNTLIEHDSPLYKTISEFKLGDKVMISGTFLSGEADYIAEGSLTEFGAMTSPEFIFRFTDIKKLK